ncbi:MAG: type II toxin-antitoxin system prevent-host-death family antitoxin [Methylobacter sp.]|nr:type II toxin-antitoxin system prevent-host-death family antitoxin [Methylobacter sp.]
MQVVNIHDAKTQLSKLLELVQAGGDVVIAKSGTPIARLIPFTAPRQKVAAPGAMADQIWMAEDFDAPLDEDFDCIKADAT